MGNVEVHDLAPVRTDERKMLDLSRKVSFKQYNKVHINISCYSELQTQNMIFYEPLSLTCPTDMKPRR